jgi:hypothetical protein
MLVAKDELHVYVANSIFCIKLIQPGANLCFSVLGLGLWCLTPLSTIFQLYRGCQFHWWRKLFRAPGENHRPAAWHTSNQTLQYPVVTIRCYSWSAGSWQVFHIVGLCVFSHQSADYSIVVAHLTSNSFEGHPSCMHADYLPFLCF